MLATVLIILLVIFLLGGGYGFYRGQTHFGLVGLLLVVVVILLLLGVIPGVHVR